MLVWQVGEADSEEDSETGRDGALTMGHCRRVGKGSRVSPLLCWHDGFAMGTDQV